MLMMRLQLPYLSWETYQSLVDGRNSKDKKRIESEHLRKTLDQFCYSGLPDTDFRDAGQTVSKWTGDEPMMDKEGRQKAAADSLVVMVDQLWIWALDAGEYIKKYPSANSLVWLTRKQIDTVVSCFPPGTTQPIAGDEGRQLTGLLGSMASDHQRCKDVIDLTALLVARSVSNVFAEKNSMTADLVGIYRWAIGIKVGNIP
jgi:hypothetical protein